MVALAPITAFTVKTSHVGRSNRVALHGTAADETTTFTRPDMSEIKEKACIDTAARMKQVQVPVSESISASGTVGVSYVSWPAQGKRISSIPIILLHGFDSSCLEYRRLGERLASRGIDVYAVDLLGWGYTQLDNVNDFSAKAKVEALEGFAQTVLGGRLYCVGGASLGGAAAIELASANPQQCQGLVLIDAQGFTDGVGPMASLPKPLAQAGVQVLKSIPLRSSANQMSYFDKETFATDEAVTIGRLHCLRDGWQDALVNFMLSGGFSPSAKVATIEAPSLVLWGRQDGILDGTEFAPKFIETLPNAELQWIEECGHVPHLEQPDKTADAIATFMRTKLPQSSPFAAAGVAVGGLAGVGAVAAAAASNLF